MRPVLARLSLALAMPLVAIGAKLLLSSAISPTPWIVVTFVAVMLASWVSGPLYGVFTALVILVAELGGVLSPAGEPAALREAAPGLEATTGVIAVLFGAVIRVTRVRERISHETAIRVTRESADVDRRWRILRRAIVEFAEVRTEIQATDLLVRRAQDLSGSRHAEVVAAPAPRDTFRDGTNEGPIRSDGTIYLPVVGEAGPLAVLRLDEAVNRPSVQVAAVEPDAAGPDTAVAHGVDEDDLIGVLALARIAGSSLDRIRLSLASGLARRSAVQSGERLERLQALTTDLAAAVTPEEIGEAIVGHTLDAMGASVGLFYVTERGGDLHLAYARGYPIGLAGHDALLHPGVSMPAVDAVRDGRMVTVETPDAWRAAYPGMSDRLGITGTRSLLALPIGHPASGVLVVQRTAEGTPGEEDLSFLEVVGHQGTQALERARLYAHEREARQLQEAFVGVMSHELRTPITTILAGSKLLGRDSHLGATSRELATDIEAEADRLFRLIEDLLVLSRLERGNLALVDEPVHLVRVLERVVASEASRWPATTFALPEERPGHLVRGDETYVEQVLRNLLSNAAKYSPADSTVQIEIERAGEEIAVRVLDEGPGVTTAEVGQLFSLFYRSPTTAASAAGAGIGLFVCRRLVDAMGGHVWARTRPERGSEFGFALGVYPDEEEPWLHSPELPREATTSTPV